MDCWNPWIQSHWVSWRHPPLFSSSCVSCWPSCSALLSGRGWVCRTVHPSQTAEPRWPCGGTERTHPAAKQSLHTERSTRPDGHPRRSHQRHWPPKRGEFLSKIPQPIATSKFYIQYLYITVFLKKDDILKPDLKKEEKWSSGCVDCGPCSHGSIGCSVHTVPESLDDMHHHWCPAHSSNCYCPPPRSHRSPTADHYLELSLTDHRETVCCCF